MSAFAPATPAGNLNVALSTFAQEFKPADAVADLIAPRVPVDRQSLQYTVFDLSDQRADRNVLVVPGGVPEEDRMSYSELPYMVTRKGLRARIPMEEEQYALGLGFSLQQKATKRLMNKLQLMREIYVAGLALNPANAANSLTLSGPNMFDAYLGSSATDQPVEVVNAAMDSIRPFGEPTHLILSTPAITALVNNPIIVERFKYTAGGAITLEQLSQVFGIKCVRAGMVQRDKNNVGSYVWGQSAVLVVAQDAPTMDDPSAMKTFVWNKAPGTVDGYGVLEFPDPQLDAFSDIISVNWWWDTRITAPQTFFPILNVCAAPTLAAIPAPQENY